MFQIMYRPFAGTKLRYVSKKSELPPFVGGACYLPSGTSLVLIDDIDLAGGRFVADGPVSIRCESSETGSLRSTGLTGNALITTTSSLPLRNISIISPTAPAINVIGGGSAALDWNSVNFINTPNVGTIQGASNFVSNSCAYINSQGLIVDGNTGTVSFRDVLFQAASGSSLKFAATSNITRRGRIEKSAFVTPLGAIGIEIEAGASIPIDQLLIEGCNFSGGSSTFITGTTALADISDFFRNKGIDNSFNAGSFYGQNLVTPTTMLILGQFVKLNIASTAGLLQRFTHSPNRLAYTGEIQRTYRIIASLSFTSGNNNVIQMRIGKFSSSGTLLETSIAQGQTTSGTGRAEGLTIEYITTLNNGEYLEIWGANTTSIINPVTVTSATLSCIAT